MEAGDIDAKRKAVICDWLQNNCDILPSRALQYAEVFTAKGISSTKRLAKNIARDASFLAAVGVDEDDAEEILAALQSVDTPSIGGSSGYSDSDAGTALSPVVVAPVPGQAPASQPAAVPAVQENKSAPAAKEEKEDVPLLISVVKSAASPALEADIVSPLSVPSVAPPVSSPLARRPASSPVVTRLSTNVEAALSPSSTVAVSCDPVRHPPTASPKAGPGSVTSSGTVKLASSAPQEKPVRRMSGHDRVESPHEWDSIISTGNPEILSMHDLIGHESREAENQPRIGRAHILPLPDNLVPTAKSDQESDGNIIKAIRRNTIGKFFQHTTNKDEASSVSSLTESERGGHSTDDVVQASRRFSLGDIVKSSKKKVTIDDKKSKHLEQADDAHAAPAVRSEPPSNVISILEGNEDASSTTSAGETSRASMIRMLSSIDENAGSGEIKMPKRRQTSANIFSKSKAPDVVDTSGESGGLSRSGSSKNRRGTESNGHDNGTIQVGKSFSLAKLFEKSDKGSHTPAFLDDHSKIARLHSDHAPNRATLDAMIAFCGELEVATDNMAGFQVVQQCNGFNMLLEAHKDDPLIVDDVVSSGVCPDLIAALLRFSDDLPVSEACLDAICSTCSLNPAHASTASKTTSSTASTTTRIAEHFCLADTFTALNAVLYNCDMQLNALTEQPENPMRGSESFAFSEPDPAVVSVVSDVGDSTVHEAAPDLTAGIATIVCLAARVMGILAGHVPNALSIADCGVYDNLLRASKNLVTDRADVAAEVCWVIRCLAANRISSAIKKLFITSENTVELLIAALKHFSNHLVCRGACRAIVNLCAIDPLCAFQLLSADVITLLADALEEQVHSPETVKWITMSLSSLLMNSRRTHVIEGAHATNNVTTEKDATSKEQSAPSGFIEAVRSRSAAAIFRGYSNHSKTIESPSGDNRSNSFFRAPSHSPKGSAADKKLFRGFSNQSHASDVTEQARLSPTGESKTGGFKSLFRRSGKSGPHAEASSEIMNRLRRSTSALHGGFTDFDARTKLDDPAVVEELVVRPVMETGLCKKIVDSLNTNGRQDASTAEWLCHTIYLLSLKETLLVELGAVKACAAVVKTITTYTGYSHVVMRRACTALGSLCVGSEENRAEVYKLNGHFCIINSLIAHGKDADLKDKAACNNSDITTPWVKELSIVQECWALKKLAVDARLRKTMMQYSLFETLSTIVSKYSGHIDISLQCVKLLLVLITREEDNSLRVSLEFKDKVSLKAFLVTINKCINDVTMAKYSLMLLTVLCCRFTNFTSVEGSQMYDKELVRNPSCRDLHACTSRTCRGWHGPYIDSSECVDWAKLNNSPSHTASIVPVCSCKSRNCDRVGGSPSGPVVPDDSIGCAATSHFNCYSLPDMQYALLLCRAPEFIVSCMKKYAQNNPSIAEWGCRALFAMTVEGRGDSSSLEPLPRRGQVSVSTAGSKSPDQVGSKTFAEDNNFRFYQFNEYSLETDIYQSGEMAFGGAVKPATGIPLNSFDSEANDISDIFVTDRLYHGYFQRCHHSSLDTRDETDAASKTIEAHEIGTQRLLNGDSVNFKITRPLLKLDVCQLLSEVFQSHNNNEQVIVWAARATSNVMSCKCYIDSQDDYKLKIVQETGPGDEKSVAESAYHVVALAKRCNLLDNVFQLMQRSALSNPAICQYLCETVYVLAQDPVLSSWMGGLGMCLLIYDIMIQYTPHYSVCRAALLAMGALAKTCPDNATRFHTDTNLVHSCDEIFLAIRHHRCEHSPGVAEVGFLAALYCSAGREGLYDGDIKMSALCPMVVNSVLEYHCNDLGVCLAVLHFVRKFTIGSEANSSLIVGDDGSFLKLLLELMQRRVEVVCGCIETAEVRMSDILQQNDAEDLARQVDVEDYFESATRVQEFSLDSPIYMNTFNNRANSWVHDKSGKLTQRHVDKYYASFYTDTRRRGDGGPYSIVSLGCALIAHFTHLKSSDEDFIDVPRPSARRIMIENGVCELLALILNSNMVDAICLGADFRQSGLVPDSAKSAATSSEYKILMGPRTAFHVLSSVVEASGVSVISRSAVHSLAAIFALLKSGCGESEATGSISDLGPRSSVQADACTRFLALGVGTSLVACLRSFPSIMNCIISRLSLNTLALLSMGCIELISRNREDYVTQYYSGQQKNAVTLKNIKLLFKDQIANADAWKTIMDAIPFFVSNRNPLLRLTEAGSDSLSADDELEARTSVGIVISACRCIISTSGFGVSTVVSGVILSQANAFNVLFSALKSLKLGGPEEVTVSLLRALAAVSHDIGSREKPDVVEVILKYMTRAANSPPSILVAALQCICSLAGGMPPNYFLDGHQTIYKDDERVLKEDASNDLHQSEAFYFDHIQRHIIAPVDGIESVVMLQSARACAKIVKTLLRQMKSADLLSPSVVGSALADIGKRSFRQGNSSFGGPTSAAQSKQPAGVIDVIQWCLIAMITMSRNDYNKSRLCTAESAECLVSLLRICGRVQIGGRSIVKRTSLRREWTLSVEDYAEMMVARGCGCDVEWNHGVCHGSFLMLTEYVIKAVIALCVGPSTGAESTLLDEICERVELGMRGEDTNTGADAGVVNLDEQGLSMMRWFKKTVKTITGQKDSSFHEANVTKFISLRTPAVLLDILAKYGDYSSMICYQGCCGLYMLCGASMGLSERGGSGAVINDLLLAGNSNAKSETTISTDVLWGRHKMPLLTSAETGIGHDSGSMDPVDAAMTLCKLLKQYTLRSRSALRACSRLVGLLASARCTSPVATALGHAGCCVDVMRALSASCDDIPSCIQVLHAITGLAASGSTDRAADRVQGDTQLGRFSQPNSIILCELGAIELISGILRKHHGADLELCMVSCSALYFLMSVPGFSSVPIGTVTEDPSQQGSEAWVDYSVGQKQVVTSGLLSNLALVLTHYSNMSFTASATGSGRVKRRSSREILAGQPATRAVMLTACLLCVARVPLFLECEAQLSGNTERGSWATCCVMPTLINKILRQFPTQRMAPIVTENLFGAGFAGLYNLLKQPDIRRGLMEESDVSDSDLWGSYATLIMDALSQCRSAATVEHGFLCMTALSFSENADRETAHRLCKLGITEEDKNSLVACRSKTYPALEALGAKGACARVLAALQTEESADVILAVLKSFYALASYGGNTPAAGDYKSCDFGHRSVLCSDRGIRRLIVAGDAFARHDARIAIVLCRIITYISSCSFSEAPIYQSRLLDNKVGVFLKSLLSLYADNPDVILSALIATSFMAHYNHKSREKLGIAGLCEPVCTLLPKYIGIDDRVVWGCLFAVGCLSANNAKNAFKIGACGACDHLVKAIKVHGSSKDLTLLDLAEWTIETVMGGNELSDCGWLYKFGIQHFGDILTVGCYAIVNIASFSDVLSLSFVSARLEAQLLSESGRTDLKQRVVEYIATRDEARAGGDDQRMYFTNLSRLRASGACELMVDLMKQQSERHGTLSKDSMIAQDASASPGGRFACDSRAIVLAALRLCDDSTNIQRMRSRGINAVLSQSYYQDNDGVNTDAAIARWRGADFWTDLIKDSVLYINCFGKSGCCEEDVTSICRDFRQKVQDC